MRRTFDMRQIGRDEFLAQLNELDKQAEAELGGPVQRTYTSDGTQTTVEWQPKTRSFSLLAEIGAKPKATGSSPMAATATPSNRLPKLASIPERIKKLEFGLEDRADKFLKRVDGTETKADGTFTRAHSKIDGYEANLGQVDTFLEEIDKATNGGPDSPLAGSAGSP